MRFTNRSNEGLDSGEVVASGYRELADNILSLKSQRPLQTLAVASSLPGEGASTVATGLATALAESGAGNILLVDCNLRAPALAERLGVEDQAGLVDAVLEGGGLQATSEFITRAGVPGLSLMTSGSRHAESSLVLASDGFKTLLEDVSRDYAAVILDSASIASGRDAAILSTLVDGLLLVIEAERANYEVIERAKARIEAVGGAIVGAVLNRRRYHTPGPIYRRL